MLDGDAQAVTPMDTVKDTTAVLVPKTDVSPVEGLIPRPPELVGAPSLYFFRAIGQHMIQTTLSNLVAATEVSDMVNLVNEAFKRLGFLDLDGCMITSSMFYTLEGALEKLPPRVDAFIKLF